MIASNEQAEAQAARVLRVKSGDEYGNDLLVFYVDIHMADWRTYREVTVTDPTIDVADLLRRIANNNTGATEVDRPEGDIIYREGERKFVVGHWETHESYPEGSPTITFELPKAEDEGDGVHRLDADDLDGLQVVVVDPVEEE